MSVKCDTPHPYICAKKQDHTLKNESVVFFSILLQPSYFTQLHKRKAHNH